MPKAWLVGGAAALAVLLVVSIVLGVTQRAEQLQEGTPERAVQRYLLAADEDDYKTAYSLLTDELRDRCPMEAFAAGSSGGRTKLDSRRVTHEDTKYVDDTAVVIARVTNISGGGGPFGSSESSYEQRFTLSLEEGEWRLARNAWPFFGCDGPFRAEPAVPRFPPAPPAPEPTDQTSTPSEMAP
jgi:hypothetical protein